MPSMFSEDPAEKEAALTRYLKANDFGSNDPKVTNLKTKKPAAGAPAKGKGKPRYQKETEAERLQSRMKMHDLQPLKEASLPAYDVTNPARYQKPMVFEPLKALVRNVQKRSADDRSDNGISAEDFKKWRESHLQMTPEQLAAVIRVTSRTVRNWESGTSAIPFTMYWVMKQLQPADLSNEYDPSKPTRYYKPVIADNGSVVLSNVLKRHAHVMQEQGVTAAEFKRWREQYMVMTPEQLGQLVRVPAQTIINWEAGEAPIPFSMWWVMHVMLQDPEVFLTRPGFHDYYIEYENGVPYFCSSRYPDIRCSPNDLYLSRSALQSVDSLRSTIASKDKAIQELQAENTRLRQMLKAGTVAAELKAMHDHIGEMMKRMQTADVVAFPEQKTAEVIQFSQATA